MPLSTKRRGADASLSRLPVAKPCTHSLCPRSCCRHDDARHNARACGSSPASSLMHDSMRCPVTMRQNKSHPQGMHQTDLVGNVEEGQVLLLLDHVGDLLPLVVRRVDARRIVRTACIPWRILDRKLAAVIHQQPSVTL